MNADEFRELFIEGLKRRNPGEEEFHQAVAEVSADMILFNEDKPKYKNDLILERLAEPDCIDVKLT